MKYDRLVFRETGRSPGWILTIDFGIGELTAKSAVSGEVRWRRLTNPLKDVLRMKLDACGFDAWDDACAGAPKGSPAWLVRFSDGESFRMVSACDAALAGMPAFASVMDLCLSLAEMRSKGEASA